MEVFAPFILLVIGWNPGHADQSWVVNQSLQPTHQLCREAGEAFIDRKQDEAAGQMAGEGVHYRYFCLPAPASHEYDKAFDTLKREK